MKKKCKGRPKPKGYRWRLLETFCVAIMGVGLCVTMQACKASEKTITDLVQNASPADRAAVLDLLAAYDAAVATPDPTDDGPAEAALMAKVQEIVVARARELGMNIGGAFGGPFGLGPFGTAVGSVAAEYIGRSMLPRNAQLIAAALRKLVGGGQSPTYRQDLEQALRLILASWGWRHSTEASAEAARATINAPPAIVAKVAAAAGAAAPVAAPVEPA